MRVIGFALGILRAGIGAIQWLISPPEKDGQDWKHRANRWGLDDARMEPHYLRVREGTLLGLGDAESKLHALLNVVVEWTRLNAQRAAKFFGMIILVQGVLLGATFGLLVTLWIS